MLPGAGQRRAGEGQPLLPRRRRPLRPLIAPSPLADALAAVPALTASAQDPWWIIGSAGVALHGADPGPIGDVDLLTSARDAAAMLAATGRTPDRYADRSCFRSVYGRLPSPGVPIEVMGGLEVWRDGWHPVAPRSRVGIRLGTATLYVPARVELLAILRSFDRPKDRLRATLLEQLR